MIVRQDDFTDAESSQMSRELAKKIEQELTYPGTNQSHGHSREPVRGKYAGRRHEGSLYRRYHGRARAPSNGSALLPKLVADQHIDVVIGNGENVAGGFGITPELAEELFDLGLAGDHHWESCVG